MSKRKFKLPEIPKITEAKLVNAVFVISPWLTPIITAWLVLNSTQKHLGWTFGQALVAALIIETNGISSTNLLMYLYRERAEKALQFIAVGIVGVYAASVLALTLALDTFPSVAKGAPVLFVFLVLSSNATVAVRAHHKAVKAEIRKPSGKARKGSVIVPEKSEDFQEVFPKDWRKFTTEHWRELGKLEIPEIVERAAVCEKTATKYYRMSRNGHSVAQ